MTPARFPQVNRVLVAPNCFGVPSCVTPEEVITRWEPTAEDLEKDSGRRAGVAPDPDHLRDAAAGLRHH